MWRFGVTPDSVWQLLAANPPRPASYVVQPGDTLSELAVEWHTDADTVARVNAISDPNLLYVGQRLRVPRGGRLSGSSRAPATPSIPAPTVPTVPSAHVVRPGDTLWELARLWGTSVEAIADANGIPNASHIWVGQRLIVP